MFRAVRAAAVVVGLVVTAGLAVGASPAAAAPPSGPLPATQTLDFCPEWAEVLCFFWGSNYQGDFIGIEDHVVNDYANPPLYFPNNTAGSGGGQRVWNNAGSAINYNSGYTVAIYYGPNRTGVHIRLNKYGLANDRSPTLGAVNNNNRSHAMSP